MRSLALILLFVGVADIAYADENETKPSVEVEIAIAIAKAKTRVKLEMSASLSLSDAKEFAIESKRPLFINYGECDCSKVCDSLRPDFITVHEKGDGKFRLAAYDADGAFWIIHDWEAMPTEKEVKDVWKIGKELMAKKR